MSLFGAIAEAVREGKELQSGETAVTASVTVATNFASVKSVVITQKIGTAPGLNSSIYTYTVSAAGVVTIFAWKPTSVSNPTLVAGTVASTVGFVILGTRR